MELTRELAEQALQEAAVSNPGPWVDHSRHVAMACQNIAARCSDLSPETAYLYGLLHDIGRHAGVTSERHLLDGYRYCTQRGWTKAAQICISHAFMIQDIETSIGVFDVSDEDYLFMKEFVASAVYDDYDRLVQLCDSLALPSGFCLLEKRFVDVTIRYGFHPHTIDRWKKVLEIKALFDRKTGGSIYDLLPGVMENSLR
ncbi:MAG: HDOD domain-containing protein [Eubacteriales bacterium]|nr:HDOD domain-containing protein [Eubacteriales bacterium]